MKHVIDALDQSVVLEYPPERMLVGLDAKYILDPLSRCDGFVPPLVSVAKPAIMKKK